MARPAHAELLDAPDSNGDTALLHATALGSTARVRQELAQGASIEAALTEGAQVLLEVAAGSAHHAVARALLQLRADANASGQYGATPLTWAAFVGDAPMVALLLDAGATVDKTDSWGDTALINVAKWSYPHAFAAYARTARLLVDGGADCTHVDDAGESALSIAESRRHEDGYAVVADAVCSAAAASADRPA